MRSGVIAETAREFFETGMDGVMASQQSSTAKDSRTNGTNVSASRKHLNIHINIKLMIMKLPMTMIGCRVMSQCRLVGKTTATTFEHGGALFVHRRRVPLQIIAPIGSVWA